MSSGAPVVLVFGLQDSPVRWLVRNLRDAGIVAVGVSQDLSTPAAQSVVTAADAVVHLFSASHGVDGRFLDYWQLAAESGIARFVAIHDLTPTSLDVNEAAAIASRVLEEDVLVTTLPLLDDHEGVIGVLDVISGEQWLPDGQVEPPRDDFCEAVEAETNTWLDEADAVGAEPGTALREGLLAAAVTIDTASRAGAGWLAAHLPPRETPPATTVLPGSGGLVIIAAGPDGIGTGSMLALAGTTTTPVRIDSLVNLFEPGLLPRLPAGGAAAARITPAVPAGTLLLPA